MTTWRVSLEQDDGSASDILVEASEEATIAELWDELSAHGFDAHALLIDGCRVSGATRVAASPLRHGSRVSAQATEAAPSTGWYIIAIAGPDTGAWSSITPESLCVGRNAAKGLFVRDKGLSRMHFSVRVVDGSDCRRGSAERQWNQHRG